MMENAITLQTKSNLRKGSAVKENGPEAVERERGKDEAPQPHDGGGARRWYGAERALAIVLPFELVLLPMAAIVSAYLPLVVVVVVALIGMAVPGRPHVGKSAWRTVRETLVWVFAALHIAIVGLWLYLAVFVEISFNAAVKDADRVVIRDGGGLCHSNPDKEPVIFEITNKAEIAAFNDMFKFAGRTMPCLCCGYPGIDWWRDGKRVAVSALHHGNALRVEGIVGDMRLTIESGRRIQEWLEEKCGIPEGEGMPMYQYCRHTRSIIESAAQKSATAGAGSKPTLDALREEFKKNGKELPSCPAGGEYSLTYGEDGSPKVKCTVPRHD